MPALATRKEIGIVGIATVSGEMWAAALDAEPSALFAKVAIEDGVRCPMPEISKPKHQVSLSKSNRCQFAAAPSHGLAVGDAEEAKMNGFLRLESPAQ